MESLNRVLLLLLFVVPALGASPGWAQNTDNESKAPASGSSIAKQKNIDEYIKLMRSDVRQQKAEIVGSIMQLSAADAAKFWPIYNDYDAELN